MKTSCIQHPAQHPLIIVRRWQIEACEGDVCAAALLSFFEYWHNIKLDARGQAKHANAVAQNHGDDPTQDESLYQWHDEETLERGVMIYKRNTIAKSLAVLYAKGFVSRHNNPNPKYKFDRTRYFVFYPTTVQAWLDESYPRILDDPNSKIGARSPKNVESSSKIGAPSVEIGAPSSNNAECTDTKSTTQSTFKEHNNNAAADFENSLSDEERALLISELLQLRVESGAAAMLVSRYPTEARRRVAWWQARDKRNTRKLGAAVRDSIEHPEKWPMEAEPPQPSRNGKSKSPAEVAAADEETATACAEVYLTLSTSERHIIDNESGDDVGRRLRLVWRYHNDKAGYALKAMRALKNGK